MPLSSKWPPFPACAKPSSGTACAVRALSPINCTKVSIELLVAASALASDSVDGQRSRPSAVMRLDLLKVVGSSPARLASPEGDSPPRSASRSSAVQTWPWVNMRWDFGCLAIRQRRQRPRNYYLYQTGFRHPPQEGECDLEVRRWRRYGRCAVRKFREKPKRLKAQAGLPTRCGKSTKFVPGRPGARPSGKGYIGAALMMRATVLSISRLDRRSRRRRENILPARAGCC